MTHREGEAGDHDVAAADPVGQRAEHDEERRAGSQRDHHDDIDRDVIDLQHGRHVEERVELAGVPDDALGRGRAEQRDQDQAPVLAAAEAFERRIVRRLALLLQPA